MLAAKNHNKERQKHQQREKEEFIREACKQISPRYRLIAFINRATSESSTFNSRSVRRILPQHWQFWRCTKFQDKNYAGQMKHQCISIFLPCLNHCMKKSNNMLGTFLIKDR